MFCIVDMTKILNKNEVKYLLELAFNQPASVSLSDLDLQYLIRIAIGNRMEGVLYNELEKLGLLDKSVFEEIKYKVERYSKRNDKLIEMLLDVSKLLQDKIVDFAVLKGGYLIQDVYKNKNERKMSDIDILVRKEDTAIVSELLMNYGFIQGKYCKETDEIVVLSKEEVMLKKLFTHELAEFVMKSEDYTINLDVNFCFSWNGYQGYSLPKITTEDALMKKHEFYISGTRLNTLDPILTLFHLCVHLYNEALFFVYDNKSTKGDLRLIRFVDIVRLIEVHHINPMELMALARILNVERQFCYVLRILKDMHPAYRQITINDFDDNELTKYYLSNGEIRYWPISPYDRMFDLDLKLQTVADLEIN